MRELTFQGVENRNPQKNITIFPFGQLNNTLVEQEGSYNEIIKKKLALLDRQKRLELKKVVEQVRK